MEVISKSVTTVQTTTTNVSLCVRNGHVVVSGKRSDGAYWEKVMHPGEAMGLWHCCVGDRTMVDVKTVDGKTLSLVYRDKEEDWELCDGEALAFLCADQALALGWALKACVTDALIKHPDCVRQIALSSAWVLSARTILTGDTAAEGADLIGGHERVFSSQEKARDVLREFLRELVNGAETEAYWEESERKVDDVLDQILDDEQKIDKSTFSWHYDGLKSSFEVTLAEHAVDGTL